MVRTTTTVSYTHLDVYKRQVLLDSSCLDRIAEILPRAEYFHLANHRMIYDAMLEMFTLGQPVDFVTVLDKLKQNPAFDQVNGKTYLLQLAQIVPSVSNVETYAGIVRDKYDIRTLITTARDCLLYTSNLAFEMGKPFCGC